MKVAMTPARCAVRTPGYLPPRAAVLKPVAVAAVKESETSEATTTSSSNSQAQEVYIGFPKNDYAPRAGRKGRVILDDPRKYPAREDLGAFLGAVGGWAGGEAALWKLRESIKEEMKSSAPAPASKKPASSEPEKLSSAGVPIYVGFSKDELELRKSGAKGRVVIDDPVKYPGKEDVGMLSAATGGFAGGEVGIKNYVATGEVRLRKLGEPGVRKSSRPSISLAILMVLAGAGGGILLTDVFDAGEGLVKSEIVQAPIDDSTKTLLLAAMGLLVVAGTIAGGRAATSALQEKLSGAQEGAQRIVVTGAFFMAVFVAARAVLEL